MTENDLSAGGREAVHTLLDQDAHPEGRFERVPVAGQLDPDPDHQQRLGVLAPQPVGLLRPLQREQDVDRVRRRGRHARALGAGRARALPRDRLRAADSPRLGDRQLVLPGRLPRGHLRLHLLARQVGQHFFTPANVLILIGYKMTKSKYLNFIETNFT